MRARLGPSPRLGVARLLARPQYEVIPLRGVEEQVAHLPPGATVTVTSSPRRGLDPTLALCESLARSGFTAVPHLSARLVRDRGHLTEITGRLAASNIREVFVIGGDSADPAGPYDSAVSLLRALDASGASDRVGVAGYPERHPGISDRTLVQALLEKQPFASYLVTQICYSARTIDAWLHRMRGAGLRLPVLVGMPGMVTRAKLLEISLRVGVGDSVRYLRKNVGVMARLLGRAGYRPDAFVSGLAAIERTDSLRGTGADATDSSNASDGASGVAGLHLNTFNQIEATERWRQELLARVREERSEESMG